MVSQKRVPGEDLFYRVNVLKITVPPLRDRVSDIPRLAEFFVRKHRKEQGEGAPPPRLTEGAIARARRAIRGRGTSASWRTRSSACSCSRGDARPS